MFNLRRKDEFIKKVLENCKDDTSIHYFVATRLYESMEKQDLSLKQLSRQAKVNETTLSMILYAKSVPSIITIVKLADALNVTIDWLVGWN